MSLASVRGAIRAARVCLIAQVTRLWLILKSLHGVELHLSRCQVRTPQPPSTPEAGYRGEGMSPFY